MNLAAARYGDAARVAVGPKTLYIFNHPDYAKHVLADNAANYHKGIGLVQAKRAIGDGLLTSDGRALARAAQDDPAGVPGQADRRPGAGDRRGGRRAGQAAAQASGRRADQHHRGDDRADPGRARPGTARGRPQRLRAASAHSFEAVQDQAMFEMVTLSTIPMWVPLPKQLRFRKARAHLERGGRGPGRRTSSARGGGDWRRRDVPADRADQQRAGPEVGKQRMRDELVTLLLAGHETTASTLSWSFYLLDEHPQVWERLHAEAVEVLGDRTPTARRPAPAALHHDGDRGGHADVPAGVDPAADGPGRTTRSAATTCRPAPTWSICPYLMHRHPGFWTDPERFDPERFAPEASSSPAALRLHPVRRRTAVLRRQQPRA